MTHYCTQLPAVPPDWLSTSVQASCGAINPPVNTRTAYVDAATCPKCQAALRAAGRLLPPQADEDPDDNEPWLDGFTEPPDPDDPDDVEIRTAPRCAEPGCNRPATPTSTRCRLHAWQPGPGQ